MWLFIKNLLFTTLIEGTVAIYLPLLITRGEPSSTQSFMQAAGVILIISGVVIYVWTVWDFATFGRGTPLPVDAPKQLVVHGLYRYIRNPMYLGVFMTILGWACVFADTKLLVYFIAVSLTVHLFVIGYEEPHLAKTFGEQYISYKASVGRWIPMVRR
jgi:protein-S-isoprenylcysteine O-methyltransferase Ste14